MKIKSIDAGSYKISKRVSQIVTMLKHCTTNPMSQIDGIPYAKGDHNEVIGTGNIDKPKKPYEVGIVVVANAIVQPRAMVVHS